MIYALIFIIFALYGLGSCGIYINAHKTGADRTKALGGMILSGIVIIGTLIFIVLGHTNRPEPQHIASVANKSSIFSATAKGMVIDNTTVRIFGEVHNISNKSGTPSCFIQATDDNTNDEGYDMVTKSSPLKPGEQWNFGQDVTVTNNDAQNATDISIDCNY